MSGASIIASARWRGLLPDGVVAYEAVGLGHATALFPEEAELVRTAVPSRIEEFAAGRQCARRALADIGYPARPLLRSPDRRPIWPAGSRGSITHTQGHCAAAVARDDGCAGLGIDVEIIGRVSEQVEQRICTSGELARLAGMAAADRRRAATVIFSAKEAFFKSQSHLPDALRDFQDVEIEMRDGGFTVLPRRQAPAALRSITLMTGRYLAEGGLVYSGIMIR